METSIKKLIKQQIAQEQDYLMEHNQVLEILRPLEGKQFNHRTFNKKVLGDFTFKSEYGMFYICGKYEHLIGYHSTPAIDVEKFKGWDACHGSAAIERIDKLNNIDVKELERISKKIDKYFNELRYLFQDLEDKNLGSFHNPIYYPMLSSIFNENDGQHREIQLHKFHYIRKTRK